ncbi:MAG: phosphohydrolase [Bacteroidetes bacterium]|nr:phosphohydrolase [Bacteroidota bacterium]
MELLLNEAIQIAVNGHKNQKDKFGNPYILHPLRVMNMGRNWQEKILGILHDVIEDCTEYSMEMLVNKGLGKEICDALSLMSRISPDEKYDDYICRIANNPLATAVKLNDLKDNMDITRFSQPITERDMNRLNKYWKAYKKLSNL